MTTKKEELAWAAGFFDGEGCFCSVIRSSGKSVSIQASISQVNKEPLERFMLAVGVGRINGPYSYKSRPTRSPFYTFVINGFKGVHKAATQLWPFLCSPKRKQYTEKVVFLQKHKLPPAWVKQKAKEFCKHGHKRTVENTYTSPTNGRRRCKVCQRVGEKGKQ